MTQLIYAGIVTFNPDMLLLERNIRAISDQVEKVVIVDNGSGNLEDIKELISAFSSDTVLIENKQNEGIAKALNQAMQYGKENHYEWMLSLDQDSECPQGFCDTLSNYFNMEDRVAMVAPVIVDRIVGVIGHNPKGEYQAVNTCITSGAITRIDVWEEIGGYDERLFIDSVDFEFCFRVRQAGYQIIQTQRVQLTHSVGEGEIVRFLFWKKRINPHSAFRCFYIAQNRIYYPRKHKLPLYVIRGNWRNFMHLLQILLYETDKRNKVERLLAGWKNGYKM